MILEKIITKLLSDQKLLILSQKLLRRELMIHTIKPNTKSLYILSIIEVKHISNKRFISVMCEDNDSYKYSVLIDELLVLQMIKSHQVLRKIDKNDDIYIKKLK